MAAKSLTIALVSASLALQVSICYADPCEGKGTIIFFVNGLFNSRDQAKKNLKDLRDAISPELSEVRNLKYELAWVEGQNKALQLAAAVVQREVDDFQQFWLWFDGVEKAPYGYQ